MSSSSSTNSFNILQTPNTNESVTLNYLPMGLSGVMLDPTNKWVTGMCSRSTSPNVVYTDSQNVTRNYYAQRLWIVGGSTGTTYPLQSFTGFASGELNANGTPTAEVIIQNFSEDGENLLYTVFLLSYVGTSAPPGGQIENIFNTIENKQTEVTVNLNSDIFGNVDPNAVYLQYTSKELGPGSNVIVYSNPIRVGSTMVEILQNNLGLFDMYASDYNIIPLSVPGQWMECDYVPIDSEEVAAYNLPLASEVLTESGNNSSIKTIMMFMIFAVLCGIAYSIVPSVYLYLVELVLGHTYMTSYSANQRIYRLDLFISVLFCVPAVVLICVGAFGDPQKIPNTGTLLTTGLTLAIFYTLCFVIVESKKSSGTFLNAALNKGD